jgi:SH3-like domain-containing protein
MAGHLFRATTLLRFPLNWAAALGWLLLAASAQDFPRAATVKADRSNVRAKPSYNGEVLATLRRGESLTVLAEVTGATNEPGGGRGWLKIRMPDQVPVWVYGPLVEANPRRVKGEVLKFRAGPGRNYSELGELKKGDVVNEIRSFDGWLQIEPPEGAVAYIATSLVSFGPTKAPVAAGAVPPPPLSVAPPAPAAAQPVAPPPVEAKAPPIPTPNTSAAASATEVPPPQPAVVPLPAAVESPVTPATNLPVNAPSGPVAAPAEKDQRIEAREVVRQGIVRRSDNIQSPGYFELRSVHQPASWFRKSEGLLDYLIVEDPEIRLESFEGQRVFINGEEWRDERWRTPVLKVKRIRPVL